MMYFLKDDHLLPIWNVIQSLTKIRELTDVIEQGMILTEAQALLVCFVLQLEPLCKDRTHPFLVKDPYSEITKRDA
jgi:hypothetical protein